MWCSVLMATATFVAALVLPSLVKCEADAPSSTKRGLVYISSSTSATDDKLFVKSSTDLTWYYNYGETPTNSLESSSLGFVPMLWGAASTDPTTDTSFLSRIKSQIDSGTNITHILTFNEPDGTASTGGSDIAADEAAKIWINEIVPLRASPYNLNVGLPAVTGYETGIEWLENFNSSCASLIKSSNSSAAWCVADFIPLHFYGSFEGLASWIGQIRAAYTTLPIWITEFAYPNATSTSSESALGTTQSFYNTSTEYFDRIDYIERYSYFGSFRSDVSNVGPDVAMLNSKGKLTDIGSWYLGGPATGNVPSQAASQARESRVLAVLLLMLTVIFAT